MDSLINYFLLVHLKYKANIILELQLSLNISIIGKWTLYFMVSKQTLEVWLLNSSLKFLDLLNQKYNKMLKAWEDHEYFIEYDKEEFLKEQRMRIDDLHKYLEEKYSKIL